MSSSEIAIRGEAPHATFVYLQISCHCLMMRVSWRSIGKRFDHLITNQVTYREGPDRAKRYNPKKLRH